MNTNNGEIAEMFVQTMHLRTVKREYKIDEKTSALELQLQQKWQGNLGSEEWIDIPSVDLTK